MSLLHTTGGTPMRRLVPGEIVSVAYTLLSGVRGVLVGIEEDGTALIRLDDHDGIFLKVPARLVFHPDDTSDN